MTAKNKKEAVASLKIFNEICIEKLIGLNADYSIQDNVSLAILLASFLKDSLSHAPIS